LRENFNPSLYKKCTDFSVQKQAQAWDEQMHNGKNQNKRIGKV